MEATQTAQSNDKKICTESECSNVQRRGTKCWKHREAADAPKRKNTSLHMSKTQKHAASPTEFVCLTACSDAHEFHVHGAGCADIKRGARNGKYWETGYTEKHESADALVAAWVADFDAQDQGWAASDFKVFPCAR